MARSLHQNRDASDDLVATVLRASSARRVLAVAAACADTLFAPQALTSAAVALQIALGLFADASRRWGRPQSAVQRQRFVRGLPIASGTTALALIGAGSRSLDRIIRDRRIHDRSERP